MTLWILYIYFLCSLLVSFTVCILVNTNLPFSSLDSMRSPLWCQQLIIIINGPIHSKNHSYVLDGHGLFWRNWRGGRRLWSQSVSNLGGRRSCYMTAPRYWPNVYSDPETNCWTVSGGGFQLQMLDTSGAVVWWMKSFACFRANLER